MFQIVLSSAYHVSLPIQTALFHCFVICSTQLLIFNGIIPSVNKELIFFLPSLEGSL